VATQVAAANDLSEPDGGVSPAAVAPQATASHTGGPSAPGGPRSDGARLGRKTDRTGTTDRAGLYSLMMMLVGTCGAFFLWAWARRREVA
jgi:hypothetical protein